MPCVFWLNLHEDHPTQTCDEEATGDVVIVEPKIGTFKYAMCLRHQTPFADHARRYVALRGGSVDIEPYRMPVREAPQLTIL